MSQDLIIDSHVHTYLSREIGLQAQQGQGRSGCAGTIDELLQLMEQAGIAKSAMLNMTPVVSMRQAALQSLPRHMSSRELAEVEGQQLARVIERQSRRNEWTCSLARENSALLAFIGLVPEMGPLAMLDEIDDKVEKGATGLGLHPAEGMFYPANVDLWPVYQRCEELGLPVIAHCGMFYGQVESACPRFFAPVLTAFPRLKLVLTQIGRPHFDEARQIATAFPNAFFDTSLAITGTRVGAFVPAGEEVQIVRELGVERVIFGSDFPWRRPAPDIDFISDLRLSSGERQAVLGENAARLFGC